MSARESSSVTVGAEEPYGWARIEVRWRPGHVRHGLRALAAAALKALLEAQEEARGESPEG